MSDNEEYLEEQADEMEALESIFMDDYVKLSDSPISFQITLVPIPGTTVDDDENHGKRNTANNNNVGK
jgi:hypothetical protein